MAETQSYSPEQKGMREELKELNVDIVEQQWWIVYEVQEGDTLWSIVKEKFWINDDSEIADSIIQVTKVNLMNDIIKEDTLSFIDWKTISQQDGIPWDLIIAWEKIIITPQKKWMSYSDVQTELNDLDNQLPDIDRLLEQ